MPKYHFDESVHVHYLDDQPLFGTSTVVGILSKPLTWWSSGKAVEVLGWSNKNIEPDINKRLATAKPIFDKVKTLQLPEYLGLLDKAYANHSVFLKDSATAGTDLHADLEAYVKLTMQGQKDIKYPERIQPFVDWCAKFVKRFLWSELHCYSESLWLGGICDCGVEMQNGDIGVIDFKSAKDAYWEHFVQAAGYAIQLEENGGYDAQGTKMFTLSKPIEFIAILPFGAKDIIPRTNHDLKGLKECFCSTLQLYKYKQSYGE